MDSSDSLIIAGAFGRVYKGIMTSSDGERTEVAVKTLKGTVLYQMPIYTHICLYAITDSRHIYIDVGVLTGHVSTAK